jgi:hypothetical protein
MIREKSATGVSGGGVLAAALVGLVVAGALLRDSAGEPGRQWLALIVALLAIAALPGLVMVNPNEGRVLQLFGDYIGTLRLPGLRWVNPLYTKRRVSLRVRNFETQSRMKVNDIDGNPIEMSAVVVWRIIDTAQATFEVDDCEKFITIAAEAALRKLAMSYPYDAHEEGRMSLRGSPLEVTDHLRTEMQERVALAGVEVIEARISNLAYAPEIAQAMLRRQQASAVIAARQKIVDGSVGMVEMALERLSQKNIVTLDEERKAAMVSNLLVVLCSENSTQPIINAGTLYQ